MLFRRSFTSPFSLRLLLPSLLNAQPFQPTLGKDLAARGSDGVEQCRLEESPSWRHGCRCSRRAAMRVRLLSIRNDGR